MGIYCTNFLVLDWLAVDWAYSIVRQVKMGQFSKCILSTLFTHLADKSFGMRTPFVMLTPLLVNHGSYIPNHEHFYQQTHKSNRPTRATPPGYTYVVIMVAILRDAHTYLVMGCISLCGDTKYLTFISRIGWLTPGGNCSGSGLRRLIQKRSPFLSGWSKPK